VIFSAPLGEQASLGYRIGVVFHGLKKDQRDRLRHFLILSYLEALRPLMNDAVFQAGLDNFVLPAEMRLALRA